MKKILAMVLVLMMAFASAAAAEGGATGVEDGVLTVAMECAYAPYNWAQPDDSNGAVPIKDSALYANGYDVMTAKAICEANGWQLEVMQLDWDSLIPAVQSGVCDAVIAGQSMTSERMEAVDFAGPYLYATIVCLVKQGSKFAEAKGISDLAGGSHGVHGLHAQDDFAHAGFLIFMGKAKGAVFLLGHPEDFADGHAGLLIQHVDAFRAEEIVADAHGGLLKVQLLQG